MSWISLDDEVGAILHALTHRVAVGPVNLTAPDAGHERRVHEDPRRAWCTARP